MTLPLEIIYHIHQFCDIDSRKQLEHVFSIKPMFYKHKTTLPHLFKKVKDLFFNQTSIFYISVPIHNTSKIMLISKSTYRNDTYVCVV